MVDVNAARKRSSFPIDFWELIVIPSQLDYLQ